VDERNNMIIMYSEDYLKLVKNAGVESTHTLGGDYTRVSFDKVSFDKFLEDVKCDKNHGYKLTTLHIGEDLAKEWEPKWITIDSYEGRSDELFDVVAKSFKTLIDMGCDKDVIINKLNEITKE
jgi:hypothetical protein